MKLYISAKFQNQNYARQVRTRLEQNLGHEVTSGWLDEVNDDGPTACRRDIADMNRADAMLFLPEHCEAGRGMWVEFGYMLAQGKPIFIFEPNAHVGACVFTTHPLVLCITRLGAIPVSCPMRDNDECMSGPRC